MNDGALTVLLVPDALHDDVRELAAGWVDAWLLDPVYLVRTGATALGIERDDTVARVAAAHVVRGQVRDVADLTAHIAGRPDGGDVELLRIVELVVSEKVARQPRDGLRAEADAIATTVKRAANRRRVHRVALIVLTTDERVRADGLMQPAWEANVLAVPENRSAPAGWDAFVRISETRGLAGFALAHAATVGGLWAGMREGAWDDVDRHGAEHVELQRVTVRAVLHGGGRIRAATEAVRSMVAHEEDPVASGVMRLRAPDGTTIGPLANDDLRDVAAEVVRGMLDDPIGRPLRARLLSVADDGGGHVGALARAIRATRDALRAMARRVRRGPVELEPALNDRIERLEQRLARAAEGRGEAVDGTTLLRWPRSPLRGEARAAAGLWRPLHDRTGLLLDGDVRAEARALHAWTAEYGLVGVGRSTDAVVPVRGRSWEFPEDLLAVIGSDSDATPTSVPHTDLLGLRTWEAVLAPWRTIAEHVLAAAEEADDADGDGDADGEDGGADVMSPDQARRLLDAIATLDAAVDHVSSSVVGRLVRAWHDESSRAAVAMERVRAALLDLLDPPRVDRRRAILAGAAVLLLLSVVGSVRPGVAVGGAVALLLAAVLLAVLRRPGHARTPDELVREAEALLQESERCETVTDGLQGMVELLSHLVHRGVLVRPLEPTDHRLPEDEDLPVLVRTAVPDDRDEDPDLPVRLSVVAPVLACLGDLVETGWRTRCHDTLLADVAVRERLVGEGMTSADALQDAVHDLIHRDPAVAREILVRLWSARGAYESRVAEQLVRRGAMSLEGSLRPDDDAPHRRTRPGLPGAPGSRVRVIDRVQSSSDMRRDGLARSLPESPNWDDFLLEGVGGEDPWSVSHFRRGGNGELSIERRRSRVHGPVRLRDRVEREDIELEFVPLRGGGGAHAEVIVRVDTQPDSLHVDSLRFFDVDVN